MRKGEGEGDSERKREWESVVYLVELESPQRFITLPILDFKKILAS